jgi:ketol-acid reductoisomerase
MTVGLPRGGAWWSKAENAGLTVREVAELGKGIDARGGLLSDEQIAEVHNNEVHGDLKEGAAQAFAQCFSARYDQVIARADLAHTCWRMP